MVGCGHTFLLAFAFPDTMDAWCPSPQTGDYWGLMNLNVDKAVLIKSDVMVAVYLMGRLADTKIILMHCYLWERIPCKN